MTATKAADELDFSACVSGRVLDGVLVVTIDNPPVNAASAAMRTGLAAGISHANDSAEIESVILTGAGRIFVGGADLTEFGKPPVDPILPDVCQLIEDSGKPVIAALNGAALGGGLEVALACHYRIAAATASMAFPEVKLGLVPGAGGTQRLPRLTGIPVAIDLIGSGRSLKANEARSAGIVDEVADGDLIARALAIATESEARFRKTGDLSVPAAPADGIETASKKIITKARGQIAPGVAVGLVAAAQTMTLEDGLAEERSAFLRLKDSPQAAALRHVFFAEREAAKVAGLESVSPRAVKAIGIVGAGLMGSGIAVAALDAGYRVIGIEQDDEAVRRGRERIAGMLGRNVKSGRLDEAGLADRLSRLTVEGTLGALGDADLVIEAVFDDLDVKMELFRKLDGVVRPDAILATNTSYLDPDEIAAATDSPERVLGLHFFSPANIMRLVEVVRCARTEPDVLATGFAVAKKMRKLPILSGVTEGFIGNRIFSAYRREAEFLVEDGAEPQDIDAAMEDFGFAMGPFSVFDLAGLEIAWARRKRQAATRDPSERYVDIADRLCEVGRFGQKSGKGWYSYADGKKSVDRDVTAIIAASRAAKSITPRHFDKAEIISRLLVAMSAEGERLLDERIAARPGDIDLVLINGYGFPAHKGGPMFMRDPEA
ncbi:enoyl-CoA hydratase/isomerase family protein [Rhizobium sp. TH2]|uniref:3-hydroxyacyl-CoA dehydrogenase NAD-binding domain-containing protein n=1 Tax=Rhizobium sp. TH2 TaxID=2775403 RepID=UPI002157EFA6|nr:3-hydroxyacyl-CoA dehydrogenase NAD-binding domain-containing protein [Rhizobium sp. TH2]UVC07971.1 enoyl-CoA hydratase/isomerase family protein [Rhizobium sp. TH2]